MLVHLPYLRGLGGVGVVPGLPDPANAGHFDDVPQDHPFYPFIQKIWKAGITTGCSTDPPKFCPDETVTRGQLAVFLARAMDASGGAATANPPVVDSDGSGFNIGGFKVSKMAAIGGLLVLVALLRK